MSQIQTREQLRSLYRTPTERALRKQLDHLDRWCTRFVELSTFVTIASSRAGGPADVSPRGGAPGFVKCLDRQTLAIPDSPGNNRLDTLENLLDNPEVGLLFLVPGVDEALRVNGRAALDDDAALRERFRVGTRPPPLVITVRVREAYLHCAKAVMRARLWDPDTRVERSVLPSLGQIIKEQAALEGEAETQEQMQARYRETLY